MTLLDVHKTIIVWLEVHDVYVHSSIMDEETLVETNSL